MAQLKETTINGNLHLKGEGVKIYVNDTEFQGGGGSGAGVQSDWDATEASNGAIKNRPSIENGEGENSLQQDSNSAFGNNSISLGADNISGCKGYYIKSIDLENKFIYLSTTKVNPEMNNVNNLDTSFSTPAYEIGDGFCIINDNYYILLATIANITNNRITFSGDIGFTTFYEDDEIDGHTFYVPSKPTIGIVTIGNYIFTEGLNNVGAGKCSYAEGRNNISAAAYAHTEGNSNTAGFNAHAEGFKTRAIGNYSHAEGHGSITNNYYAHAEGKNGVSTGQGAHAEGYYDNITEFGARANGAHSEGVNTLASGLGAHSEGRGTKATKLTSHAEGYYTEATGEYAHSEGYQTYATGAYGHSEGADTYATAKGAHAEGRGTKAASEYQHVQGKFNIEDKANTYAHIVGNGDSASKPSNAHTVDWYGNAWYAGDIQANSCSLNSQLKIGNIVLTASEDKLSITFV